MLHSVIEAIKRFLVLLQEALTIKRAKKRDEENQQIMDDPTDYFNREFAGVSDASNAEKTEPPSNEKSGEDGTGRMPE